MPKSVTDTFARSAYPHACIGQNGQQTESITELWCPPQSGTEQETEFGRTIEVVVQARENPAAA